MMMVAVIVLFLATTGVAGMVYEEQPLRKWLSVILATVASIAASFFTFVGLLRYYDQAVSVILRFINAGVDLNPAWADLIMLAGSFYLSMIVAMLCRYCFKRAKASQQRAQEEKDRTRFLQGRQEIRQGKTVTVVSIQQIRRYMEQEKEKGMSSVAKQARRQQRWFWREIAYLIDQDRLERLSAHVDDLNQVNEVVGVAGCPVESETTQATPNPVVLVTEATTVAQVTTVISQVATAQTPKVTRKKVAAITASPSKCWTTVAQVIAAIESLNDQDRTIVLRFFREYPELFEQAMGDRKCVIKLIGQGENRQVLFTLPQCQTVLAGHVMA